MKPFRLIVLCLFTAHVLRPTAYAAILPQVKNPDTFVFLPFGDVDSLDPMYAYDTASHLITHHVYETLIKFKGESIQEYEPSLSEKVPSKANGLISPDGLTYTFPIRQGVKFHSGEELSCEDAEYSIERFLFMDRAGGPSVLMLEPIAGIASTRDEKGEITADFKTISSRVRCEGRNLKITLAKPYGPFMSILPMFSYIISKKWAVSNGEWDGTEATWKKHNNPKKEGTYLFNNMNGTGPFMLERWDQKIRQITLRRNDNYWGQPAKLKRLVIKKVDEFSTRKLQLEKGDADAIMVTRQFEPQVTNVPGIVTLDVPQLAIFAIFMNQNISAQGNPYIGSGKLDGQGIPPDFFSDRDIRLAFAYAFNRDAYIKEVTRDKMKKPRGCIPEGLIGYNPKQPIRSYDMEKAKQHFQKAWGGQVWEKGFKMVAMYNAGNDVRQAAMNMLAKSVESINPKFKIDVRPLEWSTYVTEQSKKRLTLYYLGWLADFPDPHNFAHTFLHSQGTYADKVGYKNPKADKLVLQALEETNPAKREKLYFNLHQLDYEDTPYIWVYQGTHLVVLRDWVRGYYSHPVFPDHMYMYPLWKELKPEAAGGAKPKGT